MAQSELSISIVCVNAALDGVSIRVGQPPASHLALLLLPSHSSRRPGLRHVRPPCSGRLQIYAPSTREYDLLKDGKTLHLRLWFVDLEAEFSVFAQLGWLHRGLSATLLSGHNDPPRHRHVGESFGICRSVQRRDWRTESPDSWGLSLPNRCYRQSIIWSVQRRDWRTESPDSWGLSLPNRCYQ
ncbi:unnamed protein product [Protopolystoma xenopodis]|uniref:Uncharacterized protein n=1 Tax=Protopolystoma xenopodis TaxID=117903 RepID=A0A3S5FFZ8_9PLAT|nr:unnamed protein product [Protopolystoma xenopodis]